MDVEGRGENVAAPQQDRPLIVKRPSVWRPDILKVIREAFGID